MAYFAIFNVPAGLDDLELVHISHRLVGLSDCCRNCILDASFG
jgi:hypothetical protein